MDVDRALVLGALRADHLSGFELAERLRSWGLVQAVKGAIAEAKIYPLLHRLEADAEVAAAWQETARGRRRRYHAAWVEPRGDVA